MIRVMIVDDHQLVRQGIRAVLEKARDIQVVGEADDGHEAVRMALYQRPDVIIMDITMPRINGIQATAQLRRLGLSPQVIVLSVHDDETLVQQALQNGAAGYVLKRSSTQELLQAVRAARQGQCFLSQGIELSRVAAVP